MCGLSIVGTIFCFSFAAVRGGEWYRYLWVLTFGLCNLASGWLGWKTRWGFAILRYPGALWFATFALMGIAARKVPMVDHLPSAIIIATPFLAIAAYSYFMSGHGEERQLNLPLKLVHGFKRLEWRWFTPPKWDYWLVWVGLLFSPIIGGYFIVKHWSSAYGHFWLQAVIALWFAYVATFAWNWIRSPFQRSTFKSLVVSATCVRCVGIFFGYCVWVMKNGGWQPFSQGVGGYFWIVILTSLFEGAFDRCCVRQTQEGRTEYEALEGPSVGL